MVFTLVANTVGWIEGVVLIPKRMIFWRGVSVFGSILGGGRIFNFRLTNTMVYENILSKWNLIDPLEKRIKQVHTSGISGEIS